MSKNKGKPRIRTAAGMLDELDRFFSSRDVKFNEKEAVWTILTALRGPDDGQYSLKLRTTTRIRRDAFPRTAELAKSDQFGSKSDQFGSTPWSPVMGLVASGDKQAEIPGPQEAQRHFVGHVIAAMMGLATVRRQRAKAVKRAAVKPAA